MRYTKMVALAAALASGMLFGAQSTIAADLGGNCCADLEERVAELEATTARKNKRQLTMTISGQVNVGVLNYQAEAFGYKVSDTAVVHGPGSASRLQIDGRAKINPHWEAGYRFSFKWTGSSPSNILSIDRPTQDGIGARESYFFLRNDKIGAVSIGTRGQVAQSASKVDVSGKLGQVANADPRSLGTAIGGIVFQQSDGDLFATERSGVRYDSPSWAGFIISADWTNAGTAYDNFGLRLSYANQLGDFRIAAAVALAKQDSVLNNVLPFPVGSVSEAKSLAGSVGVMHVPTGLFINLGGGETDWDFALDQKSRHYSVSGGIQQKWFGIGKTTLYGQYYSSENNSIQLGIGGVPLASFGEYEISYWGLGVVQSIDAASLDLYAGYRSYDSDCATCNDKLDTFLVGGIMRF